MNLLASVKKIIKLLNPTPAIGGLTISEFSIRFLLLKEDKIFKTSLRLPPGIIEKGRIKNKKNFTLALKKLHSQIGKAKKPVDVIVNLPSFNIYSQSFSIPLLAEDKIEEAAELNLKMISPIDFKNAYSSWQKIGENFSGSGKIDILGVFVEKQLVDEYIVSLEEANFVISAIEFSGLGVSRLVAENEKMLADSSYLLIDISEEGVNLMIIRGLKLYFNHFHSWSYIKEESGGKEIGHKDFDDFIVKEVQKLINFNSSRWGGMIAQAFLISSEISDEITKVIETNFPIKIKKFEIEKYKTLEPFWFSALGSAVRGLMPRQEDVFLSLTSATVRSKYLQNRILNFIIFWKKLSITILVFILLISGAVDLFLANQEKKTNKEFLLNKASKEVIEVQELQKKAKEFNVLVEKAFEAKNQSSKWSSFFELVNGLKGEDLVFKRIAAQGQNIIINGSGKTEQSVLDFKLRLVNEENFQAVSLPLSEIKLNPDGSADFSIEFQLKSLF